MMQAWRDEFFHRCGAHGVPVRVAAKILRLAGTIQRAAEVDCSVSCERVRSYWAARGTLAEASLEKLRIGSNPAFRFDVGGDPRGCVVTIRSTTWDAAESWEIGVPGAGFTGAQMDRLCAMSH